MLKKCVCFLTRRPDPYSVLGIPVTATKEEIRKAYHRQALRFHPDSGKEGNAAKFNDIRDAYEALKDGKVSTPNMVNKTDGATGYTYEAPGSTTEGYVSGRTETYLRLFMILCFSYVILVFLTKSTSAKKEGSHEVQFDKIPFESVHQGDE